MQDKRKYLYRGPNHAANLNSMRLKDKYCDATIKVNGKEIRAHKVILAANLKYFETMFSSDSFEESRGGVVTMESVEEADLELLVSYAYTGEILLTEDNALNLLELANYLSEDGIKGACVEFLNKHLKWEEACRAYKFAKTIECLSLKNKAIAKIITNLEECLKSADYLSFDAESLMDILSDKRAKSILLRKILFKGILKWIMHDVEPRKNCLEDLLSSINITELKAGDVTGCLFQNVAHYDDDYGIIKDVVLYYEARKRERSNQGQVLMAISTLTKYQFYDFIEKKWTSPLPLSDAHGFAYWSGAVLNDKFYYIDKISKEIYLRVVDPSTKQCTTLFSESRILKWATLCACSSFLYICGGRNPNDFISDQVLRYDPRTKSLETLASMGTKRFRAVATFYQGYLYVLGGHDGSSALQTVEKYDPVRNEWTVVASMRDKRCRHAVAVLNGKLYACGGQSGGIHQRSVEVYDPTTNSWQLVASMNEPRSYHLLIAHEGKLLAIGRVYKTVEVYDPSKDQWQMNDEMSSGLEIDCCMGGLFPSSCITDTQ